MERSTYEKALELAKVDKAIREQKFTRHILGKLEQRRQIIIERNRRGK